MGKARASIRLTTSDKTPRAASSGSAVPAHVQRKVNKKVSFLKKLSTAAAAKQLKPTSSGVKKRRRPSVALSNYSALAEALGADPSPSSRSGSGPRQRGKGVKTLKTRAALGKSEAERLKSVLSNPVFQADPLAAVRSHLEATLPSAPPPAAPTIPPAQRRKEKKARRKQRGSMEED
ncbi:hypothetical protein ACKKBG_A26235 [Auxenochlorella protothecoides x Auxenochlorella symbiontica]|uniref:Ribosome biogenesis protein SLX9 n=1 Tax=Auxenochlorella protothecoides TaxID=3075 RepID=A0A1D2A734_AUXPR